MGWFSAAWVGSPGVARKGTYLIQPLASVLPGIQWAMARPRSAEDTESSSSTPMATKPSLLLWRVHRLWYKIPRNGTSLLFSLWTAALPNPVTLVWEDRRALNSRRA